MSITCVKRWKRRAWKVLGAGDIAGREHEEVGQR